MKKNQFLLGASALLAIGLTACSNEVPVDNGMVSDRDQVRFLRVAISNPPSTRAEFQDGVDNENTVGEMVFKFYDARGNALDTDNQIASEGTVTPNADSNESVGGIKEVVLQISIARNAQFPAYVMCFINPVNGAGTDLNASLEDLRSVKRSAIRDNRQNFAMTNSVYYGDDLISGASNVKISATPIPSGSLYTTKEAAMSTDAESIDIFVERYAAKVNFSVNRSEFADNKGIQVYTTANGYNLKFVPEAWTINADETQTYAIKRFENSDASSSTMPTFGQVQSMLGSWTSWNDAPLHRSYWGCSPTYYQTVFPQVSDNIIDKVTSGTGAGVPVAPYTSVYYSYKQIADPTSTSPGKGVTDFNSADGAKNWKYVMENTMGKAAFASVNPKACAPSVLMVGKYDVTVGAGTTVLTVGQGFCLYQGNLYFKGTVPTGASEGSQTILDKLLDENSTLASDQNGTLLSSSAVGQLKALFDVVHPNAAVRGTQAVPHRYVTLQLKNTVTEAQLETYPLYYKPIGSANWVRVELTTDGEGNPTQSMEELINSVNTLLWADLGNASAYTENKGYFSIPIYHLGIDENPNPPFIYKQEDDGEGNVVEVNTGVIDWEKVRVGDFGLVRNHVYNLEVDAITGLATGIEDLDNPLVPSMDDNNYWVKYRVNILNWRVVPTQGGIVLP